MNKPQTEKKDALPEQVPKAPKRKRSRVLWWFTLFCLIILIVWVLLWFFYLQFRETTDDAYANGNMVNINPAVAGSVVAFYADETDLVEEGQLLVLLDTTDYQLIY